MWLSEFANTPAVEMPYGASARSRFATTLALDPEMMAARRADGRQWT